MKAERRKARRGQHLKKKKKVFKSTHHVERLFGAWQHGFWYKGNSDTLWRLDVSAVQVNQYHIQLQPSNHIKHALTKTPTKSIQLQKQVSGHMWIKFFFFCLIKRIISFFHLHYSAPEDRPTFTRKQPGNALRVSVASLRQVSDINDHWLENRDHSYWARSWKVTRSKARLGCAQMVRVCKVFFFVCTSPTLLSITFELSDLGDLSSVVMEMVHVVGSMGLSGRICPFSLQTLWHKWMKWKLMAVGLVFSMFHH